MRLPRATCAICSNRGSVANKRVVTAGAITFYLCNRCFDGIIASADPGTLRAAYLKQATWESARDCIDMINKLFPLYGEEPVHSMEELMTQLKREGRI